MTTATADKTSGGIAGLVRFMTAAKAPTLPINLSAVVGALVAVITQSVAWSLPFMLIALLLLAWQWRGAKAGQVEIGTLVVPRVAILLALAVLALARDTSDAALLAAVVLAVLATTLEPTLAAVARAGYPVTSNLPGLRTSPGRIRLMPWVPPINGAVVAVVLIAALTPLPGWPALVAALGGLAALAVAGLRGLQTALARRRAEGKLRSALTSYEPVFAVYWQAAAGTSYQLGMWLPYLERLGKPFIVVVRTRVNFDEAVALTTAPVVLRTALTDLDDVIVPSLKTVFYMNNAIRNCHMVRYEHLTHIQLNHGDSDKAPSYNPVFRMYDKNFVAGQAAVDRFAANGVSMPAEMFAIVGRPQVEGITLARGPISALADPTVLYAPTWAGFHADSNYCSLPVGYDIIKALLARGATIVFRPHPYAANSPVLARECDRIRGLLAEDRKSTGRAHRFGTEAEKTMSVTDCFNVSDAMVSDVSSVVADYLYSEKPFAMVSVLTSAADFPKEFPLARASYVIDAHRKRLQGLDASLDEMLGSDPLAETRRSLKRYYLGDFPAESYAQRFVDEASRYV
ncbi:CDP-glycerol glycerophosphotransferase family protein [Melissospora conviva]|uniref:CDP-glycerol glycerophosphotransferase family protein n=1 Tax=Melissospora conviva TaxID=3388432 RepID=UPI003B7CEDCF